MKNVCFCYNVVKWLIVCACMHKLLCVLACMCTHPHAHWLWCVYLASNRRALRVLVVWHCRSGYPPTPNTPGSNQPCSTVSDFHGPPAGALNAAAIAAATATATATAVVLEQQNMNMNMNPQFPSPQMQVSKGGVGLVCV